MQPSKHLLRVVSLVLVLTFGVFGVASAITNGYPDGELHPYVGIAQFFVGGVPAWTCSGSLVSPTVFVTAGHCTAGADAAYVWFNSDLSQATLADASISTELYTDPAFCLGCANGLPGYATHDAGVVILSAPVTVAKYAQLPGLGVTDTLSNKAPVTVVGYGANIKTKGQPPHEWVAYGLRVFGQAEIVSTHHAISDEFLKISKNPGKGKGGTCFGDSGGPALLGTSDVMVGITSFGNNDNCAGVGYSTRVDTSSTLDFINQHLQ